MADPNESWSALTSDAALGWLVAENYSAPNCSAICDIHWWGFALLYDGGWYACDPTGMQFQINFYALPPSEPQTPVCTYTVYPTITATPYIYAGWVTLYYFSVPQLVPCCTQTAGWVTIQSIASPNGCAFLWMSACPGQGDGNSLQRSPSGGWSSTGSDLGLCLTQCAVDCQPGSYPEGEPICYDGYVDAYNGGCNWTPNVFQPIQCGQTICGTAGTYLYQGSGWRDTDWYELYLTEPAIITWEAIAEFPVQIVILDGNAGCPPTVLGLATANPCEPVQLASDCLQPGRYWLWIGTSVFTGVPCGARYVAMAGCLPCNTDPNVGRFSAWLTDGQELVPGPVNDGWHDPEFGGPWFRYPEWWNQWWPNEVLPEGEKVFHVEFDLMTWNGGWIYLALNWSTPDWTISYRPPLGWEDQFVGRQVIGRYYVDGHYAVDFTLPWCPPWISIDVIGVGAKIEGTIRHECRACVVDCQEGSIPEGEPICYDEYVDAYNGGCNWTPNVFQPIQCGQAICGESGTYLFQGLNYRDTDWYQLILTQPSIVTWKGVAEFPLRLFVIDGNAGCPGTIIGTANANACVPVSVTTACLPPGRYWLWAGPNVFTGVPCGSVYVAQVSCTPCQPTNPAQLGRFSAWMEDGVLTPGQNNDGWLSPEGEGPWFLYPQWWNEWWPNYFDLERFKRIVLDFDLLTWNQGWVRVAINWSSRDWPYPDRPPLPPEDEYVVRDIVGGFTADGHYRVVRYIPFCPRWVSVDVWGDRFWIEGTILHECCCLGDVNCDGVVNFADINPFVAALGGATPCNFCNVDVNGDGLINFADINPFVALLGSAGQCP